MVLHYMSVPIFWIKCLLYRRKPVHLAFFGVCPSFSSTLSLIFYFWLTEIDLFFIACDKLVRDTLSLHIIRGQEIKTRCHMVLQLTLSNFGTHLRHTFKIQLFPDNRGNNVSQNWIALLYSKKTRQHSNGSPQAGFSYWLHHVQGCQVIMRKICVHVWKAICRRLKNP